MIKKILISSLSISCLALQAPALAAGFAIIEHSASGMGNAFAGAAAVGEDASTVWFNPAAMSKLGDKAQMSVAGHIIVPTAKFTDTGSGFTSPLAPPLAGANDDGGSNALVPNFYYVRPINEKMTFGLGVNAPFGLEVTYNDDWIGRYLATNSEMKTININPSVSWKANDKLSLGAGVSAQYIDVTLGRSINSAGLCLQVAGALLSSPALQGQCAAALAPGQSTADSKGEISGDDLSYGFNLGLLYEPTEQTRIGVSYRSKVNHTLEGDADFTVNSALGSVFASDPGSQAILNQIIALELSDQSNITAKANLPDSASFSIAHNLNNKLELLGDVTWTGWSSFEELRVLKADGTPLTVTPEQWDDSYRVSVGGNYKYSDKLTLRTGVAFDETPIPNAQLRTPRIPGNDRTWISFGAGYKVNKKLSLDFGYSHLFVDDTPIDHTDTEVATNLTGEYEADVDIFSAQANWKF